MASADTVTERRGHGDPAAERDGGPVAGPPPVGSGSGPEATSADTRPASPASPELRLRAQLREDRQRHYGSRVHPGYQALAVYRFGRWCRRRSAAVRGMGMLFYKLVNNLIIRNVYGVEISIDAEIGRGVMIGHHQSVMIPRYCVIGDETVIRHHVTIGYATGDAPLDAVPRIGRRVDIAPGVHLIGAITIGDDVKIGPGAIVMTDVPAGSTVFAAPARVMRPRVPATPQAAVDAPAGLAATPKPASPEKAAPPADPSASGKPAEPGESADPG